MHATARFLVDPAPDFLYNSRRHGRLLGAEEMKLSTRGRYACRALLELARYYGQGTVSIDRIAEKQAISKRYLEHIFARLREADIVTGTRGSKGGYVLNRAPAEISAGEVVRAVEGPLGPVHCVDDPTSCEKVGRCVTHNLWVKAAEVLNGLLDRHTMADLLAEQIQLDAAAAAKDKANRAPEKTGEV
jgi:Rrf2 family cysteine metabolism transcriptional repressor